jgi:poly(A) polymerase
MKGSLREQLAAEIVQRLREHGHQALFAGGYVRDRLLGLEHAGDIDIATSAAPDAVARMFPRVVNVGESFGVMLVIMRGISFEVATFRSDIGIADGRHPESVVFSDARADAQRRDFTINGMFFDPLTGQVLDYVDGREDLDAGVVRAIGKPSLRFQEDYLRLLRAVRFAARFQFAIESTTWRGLREQAHNIHRVSAERIFQELDKMIRGPHPDTAIELLRHGGLLALILPELAACIDVPQPPEFHPEGDVYTHTILALSFLSSPSQTTAWSVLLHDIGKKPTMAVTDRIRFNNHHRVGAAMAMQVLRRLRSSRALAEAVHGCIDNHMNFMNVQKMRLSTLKRFLARPTIEDELELHRVDCLASHGDISNYVFLRQKQTELAREIIRPEPLVTGKDLIALGLAPGPLFGRIIDAVYELQLDEQLADKQQAIGWVRDHVHEFGAPGKTDGTQ